MWAAAGAALQAHPALAALALLLLLHQLGRRLYNAHLAEEPELYYLPTGVNRARPHAVAVRACCGCSAPAARGRGRIAAPRGALARPWCPQP
jgi:hypothetical protein